MDYAPLTDPFELPVQRLTAFCQTERSFALPPRAGATPGTTLWGAFGQALWQTACLSRRIGCAASVGARGCRFPQLCPIPWLYKPYSEVHRRNMGRPVLLHARALERHQPVEAFEIELTLWGRHAVAAREAVLRTLTTMGAAGLNVNEQSVRFQIMEIRADPVRTIAECTASLRKLDWPQTLLVFETLMSYRETVEIEPGVKKKLFLAGGTLPLPKIVGNCAFKLVAWDLEDREVGEAFDEDTRNRLCREAREAAQQTVGELEIVHWELRPADRGSRFSKQDGGHFQLLGFTGQVELRGPISSALPWLLTLVLGGGGQRRSMGFGRVRLWQGVPY